MTSTGRWTGDRVRRARAYWATTLPTQCARCGGIVTEDMRWNVDHIPARRFLPEEDWDRPEYQHVSHAKCDASAGGKLGNRIRPQSTASKAGTRSLGAAPQSRPRPLPATSLTQSNHPVQPPTRPDWWPAHLCEPPPEAVLPRIETPHHSEAVGTLGGLVVAHAAGYGLTMRWWQEYVVHRMLEYAYEADGTTIRLLWNEASVSVARQLGKGYGLLRPLLEWRTEMGPSVFGEPQTAIHLSHQVNVTMEIATPALARARELGHRVRLTNGEQEITRPDGSRWLMRSTSGAYGFSANAVFLDEAHAVQPRVVDSMLVPTMLARSNPQLLLTSTANANATPLYLRFRDSAGESEDRLAIEWSPPDEAREDPYDRAWWRFGPHQDASRERMMARQVERTNRLDFMANFLNVWPRQEVQARPAAMAGFAGLGPSGIMPPRGGVCAIDEARDGSRFARVVMVGDAVWYEEAPSLEDLVPRANLCESVAVGLTLVQVARKAGLRVEPAKYGARETAVSTPLLMKHVADGKLRHNHDVEALAQAAGMVVVEQESGMVLSAKHSAGEILVGKLIGWCLLLARGTLQVRPRIWS